ncbi:DUF222 domain-containing protein [Gordonia sp. ABSL1-1]|uniref:HNH endonuclease signature motif containing protein n=1 Tax=Gordonia sp. ABSL1-1 TaxID=3053923 RepID=UPI002572EA4C|nr:HNH endonuclease signature motif containing protein [Gordonia sp. ABSL1-1]MDL9936534.1 DUF222 domain-containing protein [Gordonia sp. ABSL1-1]
MGEPNDEYESGENRSEAAELVASLHALIDRLAATDLSRCTDAELVEVARAHEKAMNRLVHAGDRQLVEISDRGLPRAMGYRSLSNFLNIELRVSDPGRRRAQMKATAQFRQLDGRPAEAKYPALAAAFAEGAVGYAHVRTAVDVLDAIPVAVEHDRKLAAQETVAELAGKHTPAEIGQLGARLLAHLDPDGDLVNDRDRKRRRNLWLNRQGVDKMSKLTGHLDPETRGLLEVALAAWAKPGLNNPDDPDSPWGAEEHTDAEARKAAADRDARSQAQRNHDALRALLKAVLEDGLLGKTHRGLPVQLIIKVDFEDLCRHAGVGVTATGSLLPISDVIRLAAQAQPWLSVFDDAAGVPLFLGRGRRFASTGQRLASFARPGGEYCSAPGCDQPATQVEMHHSKLDFAKGGLTDITELAPACPKHNRMVSDRPGDYTTGVHLAGPDAGRTWWRRNGSPGAPPNPARVHRLPDVGRIYHQRLSQVRTRIHGPAHSGEAGREPPAGASDRYDYAEVIPPPISIVESRLALAIVLNRRRTDGTTGDR